jgi:hypothetical protein
MLSLLKPGTIVCANYADFQGNKLVGLFLVLYDEQIDASHNYKGNITAVKVTTSLNMCSNYCVCLKEEGVNDFLDKDCFALCSKVITLDKEQVYKVLGCLHPRTLRQVYKCYRRYETEVERQLEDYI